jgi:hypothetical protein
VTVVAESLPVWAYHGLQWSWGGYRFRSPQAGYNIFSGPLAYATILFGVVRVLRAHNCHVRWCPRVRFKGHPDDVGHLVCRRHHPDPDRTPGGAP